jgi:hypothetical protein
MSAINRAAAGTAVALLLLLVASGCGEADDSCVDTGGDPIDCSDDGAIPVDEYAGGTGGSPGAEIVTTTTTTTTATPADLDEAEGTIAGICIAADTFGSAAVRYKERAEMRESLQSIIEAVEADPDAPAGGDRSARDVLFDTAGHLKGCDDALELEARAAIDAL